jgi:hypothetical protein
VHGGWYPSRVPPARAGAIAVVITILAAVASVLYLAEAVTIWSFMQSAVTVGAALVGVRLVFDLSRWVRRGYLRGGTYLRGILGPFTCVRLAIVSGLAAACHFAPVEPALVIGSTALLGVLARCSTVFERNVRPKLVVEELLASVTVDTVAPADSAGDEPAENPSRPPGWTGRLREWALREVNREKSEWRESNTIGDILYYLRAAPLFALIATFFVVGSAAGLLTNPLNKPGKPSKPGHSSSSPDVTPTQISGLSLTHISPGNQAGSLLAGLPVESATVMTWDGECSNETVQQRVPAPAMRALDRLYEVESGLEPRLEGCVQHVTSHHHQTEFYATAFGINPVTMVRLSYALDSERYGSVIVLASAISLVKALVTEIGPVGGVGRFPDYNAGSGDFYLLTSPRGGYVLIRRHSNEEYVTLAPTVARAWLGAMKEDDEWLWPTTVQGHKNMVRLESDEPSASVVDQIRVNKVTGEATRKIYRYPVAPAKEISLTELVALAAKA